MPPSGVFSARSSTPTLHSAAQRSDAATWTSWKDWFSTSQPPSAEVGVPTISPFCARQSAEPSFCHSVRAEPLKVQSGTKLPFDPASGTVTATAPRKTKNAMWLRHLANIWRPRGEEFG